MHYITPGIIRSSLSAFTHTKILASTVTHQQNTKGDIDAAAGGRQLPENKLSLFFYICIRRGRREGGHWRRNLHIHSLPPRRHSFSSCQLLCLCTHTSHFVPFHALWHKKSNELHPYHLSLKFGSNTGCTEHLLGFDKYCIGCHIWKRITGDEIPWKDQNRQCVLCLSNFHLPQPACGFQHLASTVQWCDSLMCALIVSGQ